MPTDITRVDAAQAIEITDGQSQTVKVRTSDPLSGDEGLVVREVARGQQTESNSIPVVIASNQSSLSVTSNFEYPEDSIHSSGDIGVFALAVRNDSGTALAADGDYSPLQVNSTGALRIDSPRKTDDAAFSIASDLVVPMGALADETAPDSVDEGDIGIPRMTLTRILKNKLIGDFSGADVPLAVDSSGKLSISSSSIGGKTDDTAFTVASDLVLPIGFAYQSTADTVDDGDIGAARMTVNRLMMTRIAGSSDRLVEVDSRNNLNMAFGDSASLGAFGRARIALPINTFELKFDQTSQGLLTTTSTATGGAVARNSTQSTMELSITTSTGSTAILQSKQYLTYQPGRSQLILMSAVVGALKTGVRQRIGYFDVNNGLFFEQDGTNLKVVQRTNTSGSPSDSNAVNQSSWNLDKLDGTGSSGYTLNTSYANIVAIDLEWLGVGRVRMGFVINGSIVYCHEFNNANSGFTVPYMATGSLPLRWEISATGSPASSTTLKAICGCVISESGFNPRGVTRAIGTGTSVVSIGGTEIPALSLRLKSANARALLEVIRTQFLVANTDIIRWRLHLNPTLTGASWTSVSSNAISEYDVSATALTAGEILDIGFGTQDQQILNQQDSILRLASDFSGTADILTIAGQNLTGGTASAHAVMYYRELF